MSCAAVQEEKQKAESGCKVASKQIIISLFLLPNTPKLCWLDFFFSIWGFRMGFKLSPTRNHDRVSHLIFTHFIFKKNVFFIVLAIFKVTLILTTICSGLIIKLNWMEKHVIKACCGMFWPCAENTFCDIKVLI